jgi:hypothetical protein
MSAGDGAEPLVQFTVEIESHRYTTTALIAPSLSKRVHGQVTRDPTVRISRLEKY